MKNKFIIINVILIAIISISTISIGFGIDIEMDKRENLKVGDEVILTINSSEKIVGASFKINYDTNILKLLDKETENLYVSENYTQIACVYIDMEDIGTNALKIKFKVLKTDKTELKFSLEEAKFVTLGNENLYSGNEINGINKTITIEKISNDSSVGDDENNNQNNNSSNNNNSTNIGNVSNNNVNNNNASNNINNKDNTLVNTSIPKTGTSDIILVFIEITICSTVYFLIKLINIKK